MARPTYRPLANYLIRATLILSIICMIGVFAVQAVLMISQGSRHFQQEVDDIARTSVPLLSVSLWDVETKTVNAQLQLIAQRPQIGYVRLDTSIGRVFEAGNQELSAGPVNVRLTIPIPSGQSSSPQTGTVGELLLVGNQQFLLRAVMENTWSVFLGYSIFTALICGMITFLVRRELQVPLQRIARFASELTPQTLTKPLELHRPARGNTDEIDLVAEGFNKLQLGLSDHIAHLDRKVEERTQQLQALAEAHRVSSITDDLTGCLNRRTLDNRLNEEISRSQRYGRHLTIVCMDLDHFKKINDEYGHAAGDQVLRTVGAMLKRTTRQNLDWIVRMGGEEFLIVLPETDLSAGIQKAELLRVALNSEPVVHNDQQLLITASFGVAQWQSPEPGQSLITRADHLLYAAKSAGRNRVLSTATSST